MLTQERAVAEKARVREFWEDRPCGAKHADAPEGTPAFFAQVEASRTALEPFIAAYADFEGARGRRLLEIGVGLGTDLVRFGRAGADLTGIDLTERAISLARRRLDQEGLTADLRVGDAERLPFADGEFDRVYSWGVLHHTPEPERAMAEALRVLKPGGELCVMVYGRRSWVAFALWARHALLAGRPRRSLADVVAAHMESDGTRAYTEAELRRIFGSLDELRIDRVITPYDRRVAGPLTRGPGARFGWFMVVRGRAPSAQRVAQG